jgi:DNA-binding transcriptional regulator YiaG
MTPRQFKLTIARLRMTQAAAARYLGVSERTAHRYANGETKIQAAEALLLRALIHHHEEPHIPKWTG